MLNLLLASIFNAIEISYFLINAVTINQHIYAMALKFSAYMILLGSEGLIDYTVGGIHCNPPFPLLISIMDLVCDSERRWSWEQDASHLCNLIAEVTRKLYGNALFCPDGAEGMHQRGTYTTAPKLPRHVSTFEIQTDFAVLSRISFTKMAQHL